MHSLSHLIFGNYHIIRLFEYSISIYTKIYSRHLSKTPYDSKCQIALRSRESSLNQYPLCLFLLRMGHNFLLLGCRAGLDCVLLLFPSFKFWVSTSLPAFFHSPVPEASCFFVFCQSLSLLFWDKWSGMSLLHNNSYIFKDIFWNVEII